MKPGDESLYEDIAFFIQEEIIAEEDVRTLRQYLKEGEAKNEQSDK
jgi:hypothetical protein